MMWGEIISWCGVRILHAVCVWDYWMMWGEIIGWCGVRFIGWRGMRFGVRLFHDLGMRIIAWCCKRLLDDVGWDYWMMWGEFIGWRGVRLRSGMRLLHDVGELIAWCWVRLLEGCGVRLLHDMVWDYCLICVRLLHDVGWHYCRMLCEKSG